VICSASLGPPLHPDCRAGCASVAHVAVPSSSPVPFPFPSRHSEAAWITTHTVPVPATPFTVLLVCTGNICRSALAERLGRAHLDELLSDAGAMCLVSAGTHAVVGSGMHPDSELVLRGMGAEPGDFHARQLVDSFVTKSDLVLTMTRRHRSDVLALTPRALARTFTLREAAALVGLVGEAVEPPGDDLTDHARHLVRKMVAARSRRHGGEQDDIRDPIGRPAEVHQEVGLAISEALLPILRRFAALLPSDDDRRDP
jgi:protein-tyrosine-phosphatase